MQTFNLDLSIRRVIPLLYVKQNDVGTKISVVLTDNGSAYSIPSGAVFSVWYSGASGEGNYTAINGKSAFSVSGNKVTVELILQMLQNAGPGQMCLVMNKADGTQLGLWNIPYCVEKLPGEGSNEATAYYTAFLEAVNKMGAFAIESTAHPGCYYRIVDGETEWFNPPMVLGVEYRTTERHLGKPVYTKAMDFDALPNNAQTYTSTGLAGKATSMLRYAGTRSDGESLPMWFNDRYVTLYASVGNVYIRTNYDCSALTATVTLWYVK